MQIINNHMERHEAVMMGVICLELESVAEDVVRCPRMMESVTDHHSVTSAITIQSVDFQQKTVPHPMATIELSPFYNIVLHTNHNTSA